MLNGTLILSWWWHFMWCVCVYAFSWVCKCTCVWTHVCMPDVHLCFFFPQESSAHVLRQALSLTWRLPSSLGYLGSRAQEIHLFPPSRHWDYRSLPVPSFSHHSWGSNSGPNAHLAGTLLTVLPLRSPFHDFNTCVWLVPANLGSPLMKNSGTYYSFSHFSPKFQFPRSH